MGDLAHSRLGCRHVPPPCHLLGHEAQPVTLVCNAAAQAAKASGGIRRCMGDAFMGRVHLPCPFLGHEAQPGYISL